MIASSVQQVALKADEHWSRGLVLCEWSTSDTRAEHNVLSASADDECITWVNGDAATHIVRFLSGWTFHLWLKLAILKMVSSETDDGSFEGKWSLSVQVLPMGFIAVASCLALAAVVSNALIESFWSLDGWPFDACVCLSIRQVYEDRIDHDGEPGSTKEGG